MYMYVGARIYICGEDWVCRCMHTYWWGMGMNVLHTHICTFILMRECDICMYAYACIYMYIGACICMWGGLSMSVYVCGEDWV